MSDITIRLRQTIQVTAWSSHEVTMSITYSSDATDEELDALIEGPVERGYKRLSKAVRAKCNEEKAATLKDLAEEPMGEREGA